ncbi:hypothetical protein LEMLEM_LOCUS18979, partial [Lemmus lemmus]
MCLSPQHSDFNRHLQEDGVWKPSTPCRCGQGMRTVESVMSSEAIINSFAVCFLSILCPCEAKLSVSWLLPASHPIP